MIILKWILIIFLTLSIIGGILNTIEYKNNKKQMLVSILAIIMEIILLIYIIFK